MAVNPKIHPGYQSTVTGRLVKRELELQRLPLRTETAREIRKAFSRPPEGYVLVEPDYAAIELRVYAALLRRKKTGDE